MFVAKIELPLVVQIVVRSRGRGRTGARATTLGIWKLEVARTESTRLVKRLAKGLVLANVRIGDRFSRVLHRFFEVRLGNFRHRVLGVLVLHRIRVHSSGTFGLDITLNALTNGVLARALAYLGNVFFFYYMG